MKVNRAKLAEILVVSTATVSRMIKQGMPVAVAPDSQDVSGQWSFDTAEVVR
jgi:phage terminase Nu1 subunit (DNA packaging protein)